MNVSSVSSLIASVIKRHRRKDAPSGISFLVGALFAVGSALRPAALHGCGEIIQIFFLFR